MGEPEPATSAAGSHDLTVALIEHLSKEIETQVNSMTVWRNRVNFTAFFGDWATLAVGPSREAAMSRPTPAATAVTTLRCMVRLDSCRCGSALPSGWMGDAWVGRCSGSLERSLAAWTTHRCAPPGAQTFRSQPPYVSFEMTERFALGDAHT